MVYFLKKEASSGVYDATFSRAGYSAKYYFAKRLEVVGCFDQPGSEAPFVHLAEHLDFDYFFGVFVLDSRRTSNAKQEIIIGSTTHSSDYLLQAYTCLAASV